MPSSTNRVLQVGCAAVMAAFATGLAAQLEMFACFTTATHPGGVCGKHYPSGFPWTPCSSCDTSQPFKCRPYVSVSDILTVTTQALLGNPGFDDECQNSTLSWCVIRPGTCVITGSCENEQWIKGCSFVTDDQLFVRTSDFGWHACGSPCQGMFPS